MGIYTHIPGKPDLTPAITDNHYNYDKAIPYTDRGTDDDQPANLYPYVKWAMV